MATFGQIVYMVLDVLKEHSDDAYYTEEHIIFLASKMRALLLERKYKATRNSAFSTMSNENLQEICLSVEPTELLPESCAGTWLKSTEKIPGLLGVGYPKISTINDLLHSSVTFVPMERMPYVGYNKWLKNIIYAARSADGYLYLNSNNQQFLYLTNVKMSAAFSDPEAVGKLLCNGVDGNGCDILSQEFPLEASLVPSCIELVVQELAGSRYTPEDKDNNARDDLGKVGLATSRAPKPVENSTYKPREAVEE